MAMTGEQARSQFFLSVEGVKRLEKTLQKLPAKLARRAFRKPMREHAKTILKQAKANCPVDSGALRKALKVKSIKRSRVRQGVIVVADERWFVGDVFYGGMIEFGTEKMRAQHFVERAYDQHKDSVLRNIERDILANIEREAAAAGIKMPTMEA